MVDVKEKTSVQKIKGLLTFSNCLVVFWGSTSISKSKILIYLRLTFENFAALESFETLKRQTKTKVHFVEADRVLMPNLLSERQAGNDGMGQVRL